MIHKKKPKKIFFNSYPTWYLKNICTDIENKIKGKELKKSRFLKAYKNIKRLPLNTATKKGILGLININIKLVNKEIKKLNNRHYYAWNVYLTKLNKENHEN